MMLDQTEARQLLLQKLKFRVAAPVSDELVRDPDSIDVAVSIIRHEWWVYADWHIPGKRTTREIGSVEVPDGWWQAFKAEVFPRWLRRRFPPRMREITNHLELIRVAPQIPWPPDAKGSAELFFFFTDDR